MSGNKPTPSNKPKVDIGKRSKQLLVEYRRTLQWSADIATLSNIHDDKTQELLIEYTQPLLYR